MFVDNVGASGVTPAQYKPKEENSGESFQNLLLAAAQSGKTSAGPPTEISDERKTYKEILDTGFTKWVQETRKEEMEEKIRERVLASMGITEEQLAEMPAEQKAAIEKLIQDYIQQAMTEKGQDNAKEIQNKGQVYVPVMPGAL